MYCSKCEKEIPKKESGNHKRWCGNKKVIKDSYCKTCNTSIKNTRTNSVRKYCSRECFNKGVYTKEFKQKISNSRKKYLKENPDSHPWRSKNKFNSVPCEKLKKFLKEKNIDFIEEYQPLENRFFSIDIAIPEVMFGIEVNGEQHYNSDKSLKKYYQQRHDMIKSKGWTIYEIHYSKVYDDVFLSNLIERIRKNNFDNFTIDFELRKNKSERRKEERKIYLKAKEEKAKSLLETRLEHIRKTEKTWGWVSKAAKELDISHTHVRRLVNKYLTDI